MNNNYPVATAYPVNDDVEAAPAHGAVTGTGNGPVTSQPKAHHGPQPGDRVIVQDNGRGGATGRNGRPHTWVILSVISMIFCWYVISLHLVASSRSNKTCSNCVLFNVDLKRHALLQHTCGYCFCAVHECHMLTLVSTCCVCARAAGQ
jgi:hypothetical protein